MFQNRQYGRPGFRRSEYIITNSLTHILLIRLR